MEQKDNAIFENIDKAHIWMQLVAEVLVDESDFFLDSSQNNDIFHSNIVNLS